MRKQPKRVRGDVHWASAILLATGACTGPTIAPPATASILDESGLRFSLTLHPRASTEDLSWTGTISNEATDPMRVEYGDCGLEVTALDENDDALWSSARRGPSDGDHVYLCALQLATADLAPGEAMSPREFRLSFPVAELLGDSLPKGPYRFEAWFDLARRRVGPLILQRAVMIE